MLVTRDSVGAALHAKGGGCVRVFVCVRARAGVGETPDYLTVSKSSHGGPTDFGGGSSG